MSEYERLTLHEVKRCDDQELINDFAWCMRDLERLQRREDDVSTLIANCHLLNTELLRRMSRD